MEKKYFVYLVVFLIIIEVYAPFFAMADRGNKSALQNYNTLQYKNHEGKENSKASSSWSFLTINGTIGSVASSTSLSFNSSMTTGLDVTYDAGLLRGSSGLEIYSRLVKDNGIDFAGQCLPTEFDSLTVRIGIDCSVSGTLQLGAVLTGISSDWVITFEDSVLHTFTPVSNSMSVSIAGAKGLKGVNRFKVHIKNNSVKSQLTVSNQSFESGAVKCFNALDTLFVAGYETTVTANSGSTVDFISGNTMRFLPGFHAMEGSYIHGSITSNSSFCTSGNGSIAENSDTKDTESLALTNRPAEKGAFTGTISDKYNKNNSRMKIYYSGGDIVLDGTFETGTTVYLNDINGRVLGVYKLTDLSTNRIKADYKSKGIFFLKLVQGRNSYQTKIVIR